MHTMYYQSKIDLVEFEKFPLRTEHSRNLMQINVDRFRTEVGRNSFKYRGSVLRSALPKGLRQTKNYTVFKNKLKRHNKLTSNFKFTKGNTLFLLRVPGLEQASTIIVCQSVLLPVSWMSLLLDSKMLVVKVLRLLMYDVLSLPLTRFPSILPHSMSFSIPSFLMMWSKNFSCRFLMVFISDCCVPPAVTLLHWSFSLSRIF